MRCWGYFPDIVGMASGLNAQHGTPYTDRTKTDIGVIKDSCPVSFVITGNMISLDK